MKRLFWLVILLFSSVFVNAQIQIGFRDNSYVNAFYTSRIGLGGGLEQSVFPEVRKYQYVRLLTFYSINIKTSKIIICPYYGRTYGKVYWSTGAYVDYSFNKEIFFVGGILNPMCDSDFGDIVAYRVYGAAHLYKMIWLTLQYGTIPEYRDVESRYRFGLIFKGDDISVTPQMSFRMPWNSRNIRFLVSMSYEL